MPLQKRQKPRPGEMMRPSRWTVTDADRAIFRRHLRSFVPPDAFDAHAHLYPAAAAGGDVSSETDVGLATYRASMRAWMGDRCPRDGLFFGPPTPPGLSVPRENAFLMNELRRRPGSRGLLLARPDDDPAAFEAELVRTGASGLKVYYLFLNRPDSAQAQIDAYVPRWMWELADRRGLSIMIHIVRSLALADAGNQRSLRKNCTRFPNARVILAHAARGFCGRHTVDGIGALAGLENVWFDTSAICESDPLIAVLNAFGPSRLMFGSDFPVSAMRGRAVSIGDGFAWFMDHSLEWQGTSTVPPTLIGIESLLALKRAVTLSRQGDAAVEAIFGGNAREMLGID